tara:strand:+ start:143 stop:703 length:561 start_codon:yes stop_codon:yes gene_type:complete
MPKFEEEENKNKEEVPYSPRNSDKARTRRRSGGFKNEYSSNTSMPNIGELTPSEIKEEQIESSATEEAKSSAISDYEESTPSKKLHENKSSSPKKKKSPISQETLRVIQEIEEKVSEKKKAREARYAEKKSRRRTRKKKGFLSAIASIFAGLFGKAKKNSPRGRGRKTHYNKGRQRRRSNPNQRRR